MRVQELTLGRLATLEGVWDYVFAGKAIFTLVSKKTKARMTYRVRAPNKISRYNDRAIPYWAHVRSGRWEFAGVIWRGKRHAVFNIHSRTELTHDDLRIITLKWAMNALTAGILLEKVEFWHEGTCGRCGQALTVPKSIRTGFGPECVRKVQGGSSWT